MTNWQQEINDAISSLGSGEGADFGYAYVERLDYETYQVQSYAPLENLQFDFNGALARTIEVANQALPRTQTASTQQSTITKPALTLASQKPLSLSSSF